MTMALPSSSPRADLLVVAPAEYGHHTEYMRWILEEAHRHGQDRIFAAGPVGLLDSDTIRPLLTRGVEALPLPEMDQAYVSGSLWRKGRHTAAGIRRAVHQVRPHAVLLTYLDHAQLGLATGLRFNFPVQVSGILFRPTFGDAIPRTPSAMLRDTRKRLLLRAASRNPHLDRVFTLDPDAVTPLCARGVNAVYLPDPVEPSMPTADADAVRTHYGVEPGRQIATLFGSLEARKGLFELLESLPLLHPDVARRVAIVIAGKTYDSIRPRLLSTIQETRAASLVQIIFREAFLSSTDLTSLVAASDLILAPYRGHIGSSGVVLRAAAAGVPVLAPVTGLIGRDVLRNRLGVRVDTADPADIARGIALGLDRTEFDASSAAVYTATHAVERFGEVLFGDVASRPN